MLRPRSKRYYPVLLPNDTLRRAPSTRTKRNATRAEVDDRVALATDLVRLIWQHKLWWAVPLVLALLVLGVLLVLEATPVGPLLYRLL